MLISLKERQIFFVSFPQRFSEPTSGPYLFPSWRSLPFNILTWSIGVPPSGLLKQPSRSKGAVPNLYGWLVDMIYTELTQKMTILEQIREPNCNGYFILLDFNPTALICSKFLYFHCRSKKKDLYGSSRWVIIKDIVVCKVLVSFKKALSLYMSFILIKAC